MLMRVVANPFQQRLAHVMPGFRAGGQERIQSAAREELGVPRHHHRGGTGEIENVFVNRDADPTAAFRSEEHTSELQSRGHLVCRLLHEKKKNDACGQTDWALSGRIYEVEENINTKNNQLMKKEDHLNRSQHMQDAGLSVYVVYLVC